MKFTRSEIHKRAHLTPMEFEAQINMDELTELDNDLIRISDIIVKGKVAYNKNEHYIFDYSLQGTMVLPCARTLIEVDYPFHLTAREIYSPDADDDSDEIKSFTGEVLDLTPSIKENILLDIPYRVFATKEELENAPKSGAGWSLISEEEQSEKIDPRLEKLQSFFDHKK